MQHSDFEIGTTFYTRGGKWRCTDVGTRTIAAIILDPVRTNLGTLTEEQAQADGWFNGPPYAVAEFLFDEDDFEGCCRTREEYDRDFGPDEAAVSPS